MNRSYFLLLYFIFFLIIPVKLFPVSLPAKNNDNWKILVLYVYEGKAPVHIKPQTDSDTTGFVYYRDKILVVEEGYGVFGWSKVVYPKKGFVETRFLITEDEKKENDAKYNRQEEAASKWIAVIKECPINYIFVKEQMDESSPTTGLLSAGEKFLFVKDKLNGSGVWTKVLYPYEGYIKTEEMSAGSQPVISIGVSYSAINTPYEKNLKNYFNPLGGIIEYTKTKWNFSFGIGYVHSEARLAQYFLKTDRVFLETKFKFLHLFNRKLETYVLAGGNYWFSSFQNLKYPALTSSYYKKEKDSGPAYSLGAGIIYTLNGFYIETQYSFFNSRQAKFGSIPPQGEFGNYYKLYPGENHLSIIVGYKFLL